MSVKYSNSALVVYTALSPNCNESRVHSKHNPTGKITKITVHHMAGNLTVESCGKVFAPTSRQASANYGIGSDGRIALYVNESSRAWTSSSANNDYNAVTIEVANDQIGGEWHVSDAAWDSLVNLCADICKRNDIVELNWTGDKSGNLTVHRFFAATACPGPYLFGHMGELAKLVNEQLKDKPAAPAPAAPAAPAKLSAAELAEGMKRGDYGNGAARKKKLKDLGYTDAEIQAAQDIVNGKASAPAPSQPEPPKPTKLTAEQLAEAILAGKYGNGDARKAALKAEGYTDAEITAAQKAVNAKVSGNKPATTAKPSATYYVVKTGDCLSKIAQRYGTTTAKIMALNKGVIKNANIIRVGQKIRVK